MSLLIAGGGLMLAAPILRPQPSTDWQADARADHLADVLASDVDRDVRRLDMVLEMVMAGRQTPASKNLSPDERNALLRSRVPRDANISFLDVLDADGAVLATLQPNGPASNWSGQDYFRQQRDNVSDTLVVGQPYSLTQEDAVGLTISRRITGSGNQFTGVAVLGVRLAYFLGQLNSHDLGNAESVTLLYSRGGQVLMRMPFDIKDIGHPIDPIEPFHAFMRSELPPYVTHDAADRVERHYAFHRVGNLPLVVMVARRIPDR